MKKFFGLLTLLVVLCAANISYAAKIQTLADIDAYNFFLNIGYEVDCSYWERTRDGKQLFAAIIPEEPLIISKESPNVEVYAEPRKGHVVEVVLYLRAVEADALTAAVAKAVNALDAETFQANQSAVEQTISELLTSPQMTETILAFGTNRYALTKETQHVNLIVRIKPAPQNS